MTQTNKQTAEVVYVGEIWKPISLDNNPLFGEMYLVSNYSRVFSVRSNKILSPCFDGDGYVKVGLSCLGKKRSIGAHRLAALAFIPNPDNKPFTNHKDGCKTNNHIDNLEWATGSENTQHAYDNKLIQHSGRKKGQRLTKETITKITNAVTGTKVGIHKKIIVCSNGAEYSSVTEAIAAANINKKTFFKRVKNKEAIRGIFYEYK